MGIYNNVNRVNWKQIREMFTGEVSKDHSLEFKALCKTIPKALDMFNSTTNFHWHAKDEKRDEKEH